jgi:hypothetical protein
MWYDVLWGRTSSWCVLVIASLSVSLMQSHRCMIAPLCEWYMLLSEHGILRDEMIVGVFVSRYAGIDTLDVVGIPSVLELRWRWNWWKKRLCGPKRMRLQGSHDIQT